ncbi:MAG: hypothetical protein EXR27_20645 [Betaproteobacteria bacterium]|nr:hypothetical protein [Betaproteobacteria bacterium]
MIDIRPRHQFGFVMPTPLASLFEYQFALVCPPDCLDVGYPINLSGFTAKGVDEALERYWPAFDWLAKWGVERICLGGIPLSAYAGRPRILALLEEAKRRSNVVASCDFEECIQAMQQMGIRRVAVAAKWDDELMRRVCDYLAHAGIESLGYYSNPHSAEQVFALRPDESVEVALALGRGAFAKMPEAEGLLLAGGAWLALQAVPMLEEEFGRPVINNPCSSYWSALKQTGLKPRRKGFGKVLDSLYE